MTGETSPEYLSVREAAERLALSEEAVRRMIRGGELYAEKAGRGSRAPWGIDARQIEAYAEEAERRRRLAGVVVGRGEQFVERMGNEHGPEGREWTRGNLERQELLDALADAIGPELQEFEDETAEAEYIEEQAQDLARRVRRAEAIRRRAEELLTE